MTLPNDPVRRYRIRERWSLLIGAAATAALAVWAGQPTPPPASAEYVERPITADAAPRAGSETRASQALDVSVFDVALWNPPRSVAPSEPASVAPAPPPLPPRLELLAIIRNGETIRAALYDVDSDELLNVAAGDRAGRFEVTEIHPDLVRLTDGRRVFEIDLPTGSDIPDRDGLAPGEGR